MAITRAQQAKQMLRDGGRTGFRIGSDEGDVSGREYGGSSGAVDTGDLGSEAANVAANQAARDYSDSSPVDTGDLGTQAANVAALRDANKFRGDNRIARAINLLNPFSKERQKLSYRLSMKLPGQEKRSAKYQKAYKDYLESLGITEEDLEGELPSSDFFVNKAFKENLKPVDAMLDPPMSYGDFLLKEFNNPTVKYRGDIGRYREEMGLDNDDPPLLFPLTGIMAQTPEEEQEPEYVNPLSKLTPRIAGSRFAAAGSGIASLEDMDREGFLLGGIAKGLKKAVRGIKKLAKSPIGKAALGFAALKYGGGKSFLFGAKGPPGIAKTGMLQKLFLKNPSLGFSLSNINPTTGILAASALAGAMTPKEDEDKFDLDSYYASGKLNPSLSTRMMGSDFDFYGGQRIASAEGGSTDKEPVAKKTMPLLDMDGKEMDLREDGGFVPIGRMEKADDVPARLSKNEFVFTADAVRNAGDGDVDKGAEVMYNMMKNLEAGGEVSEESQGLEGARKMFQTSQRLEEVL